MSSTLVNAGKRLMATDKSRVAAVNGRLGRGYSPCHRVMEVARTGVKRIWKNIFLENLHYWPVKEPLPDFASESIKLEALASPRQNLSLFSTMMKQLVRLYRTLSITKRKLSFTLIPEYLAATRTFRAATDCGLHFIYHRQKILPVSLLEEYGRGFGGQNLNLFESSIQSFVAGNDFAHHGGLPSSVLVINDCLSILHGHPHGILLTVAANISSVNSVINLSPFQCSYPPTRLPMIIQEDSTSLTEKKY